LPTKPGFSGIAYFQLEAIRETQIVLTVSLKAQVIRFDVFVTFCVIGRGYFVRLQIQWRTAQRTNPRTTECIATIAWNWTKNISQMFCVLLYPQNV